MGAIQSAAKSNIHCKDKFAPFLKLTRGERALGWLRLSPEFPETAVTGMEEVFSASAELPNTEPAW